MRVIISGSSGLIGSTVVTRLAANSHTIIRLVRGGQSPGPGRVPWEPQEGRLDKDWLEGSDAVVHLAGENIASGRWTAARKARIRESRVAGTSLLCNTLAQCAHPPKVLFSASAIGFYGDRGAEWLTEDSSPGAGFLPEVCQAWERATQPAVDKGIRVVHGRIGMVLSVRGGALAKMLPPFRLGLGGVVGNGRQFISWIEIDDLASAIEHVLLHESIRGPVNLVAPVPVTNREFTRAMGSVLRRPTVFPIPAFAARLAFGQMADALLLASTRVRSTRLAQSGFMFAHPDAAGALRHLLRK